MTNKQILVLNKITELCRAIPGIAYAGLYPEAIGKIGQRFPACIIMDGNEDNSNYDLGQTVRYDYTVSVILHHEVRLGVTRIADILDLQNKIITAVATDLSIDGTVHCLVGHSVEKGSSLNVLADTASGYQGEISARTINFTIQIYDSRR